jgi:hypothetical protein
MHRSPTVNERSRPSSAWVLPATWSAPGDLRHQPHLDHDRNALPRLVVELAGASEQRDPAVEDLKVRGRGQGRDPGLLQRLVPAHRSPPRRQSSDLERGHHLLLVRHRFATLSPPRTALRGALGRTGGHVTVHHSEGSDASCAVSFHHHGPSTWGRLGGRWPARSGTPTGRRSLRAPRSRCSLTWWRRWAQDGRVVRIHRGDA